MSCAIASSGIWLKTRVEAFRSREPNRGSSVTWEKRLIALTSELNDFSGWEAPTKLPITSPAWAGHPGKELWHWHTQWVSERSKLPVDTDADLWGLSPDETTLEFSTQVKSHITLSDWQTEGGRLWHSLWVWTPSVLIKTSCYIQYFDYIYTENLHTDKTPNIHYCANVWGRYVFFSCFSKSLVCSPRLYLSDQKIQ